MFFVNKNRLYSNMNSTELRNGTAISSSLINNQTYLIRDDSDLVVGYLRPFVSKNNLHIANKTFVNKITKIIKERIPSDVGVKIVNAKEQLNQAKIALEKLQIHNPTISLDAHYIGDYNISLTRVFDLGDSQIRPIDFASRMEGSNIQDEIKKIPSGLYTLIEDDI